MLQNTMPRSSLSQQRIQPDNRANPARIIVLLAALKEQDKPT
jgi:hypothetical protein